MNYGWPSAWFSRFAWAQEFVVTQEGRAQALVTTAHVATGSLILVTSLLVALRSFLLPAVAQRAGGRIVAAEVLV